MRTIDVETCIGTTIDSALGGNMPAPYGMVRCSKDWLIDGRVLTWFGDGFLVFIIIIVFILGKHGP